MNQARSAERDAEYRMVTENQRSPKYYLAKGENIAFGIIADSINYILDCKTEPVKEANK